MVFEQAADPPRSEPRSRWDKLLRIPERVYPTNRFTITFRGKVVGSATTLEKAKDRITEHRATGDPVPFWENPVAYTAPATELADQIESD
jgi:hypothetical protein